MDDKIRVTMPTSNPRPTDAATAAPQATRDPLQHLATHDSRPTVAVSSAAQPTTPAAPVASAPAAPTTVSVSTVQPTVVPPVHMEDVAAPAKTTTDAKPKPTIAPKLKTESDTAVDDSVNYSNTTEADSIPDATLDDDDAPDARNADDDFDSTLDTISNISICVPLGTAEEMDKVSLETIAHSKSPNPMRDDYEALRVGNARGAITPATDTYNDALKLAAKKSPTGNLKEILVDRVDGIGDDPGHAPTPADKEVNVRGYGGYIAMMTMTGGLRRVTLWNSGIQLRLRNPSIDQLITFQRSLDEMNDMYGANLGLPYYQFADALINGFIIDDFLPRVVTNSNTEFKNDWDMLKRYISYQDYQTILIGLLSMMYPNGIKTNFVCGNPSCRHQETLNFDLSKLHLLNRELIPQEAVQHFHRKGKATAAQLDEYRKNLDLDRTITFSYPAEGATRKWKLQLQQCSLAQWTTAGRDYLHTLETMDFRKEQDVRLFLSTTDIRMLKPWIATAETYMVRNGETYNYVIHNDGTDEYAGMALDEVMQEWTICYPQIRQDIINYILGTRISHSAFYYPKCTQCGAPSNVATQGYVSYDALYGFFTLSQLKVMQTVSLSSKNTTTTM